MAEIRMCLTTNPKGIHINDVLQQRSSVLGWQLVFNGKNGKAVAVRQKGGRLLSQVRSLTSEPM